jgi:spore germination cell wall hydrolase CwlJ-like protein
VREFSVRAFATAAFLVVSALASCAETGVTKMARNAPVAPAAPGGAELACLAEAVYFEARGTGAQGEAAVAHVVVNRAESREFPRTVCGVVADGCQFSYRCDGRSDALADGGARSRAFRTAQAVLAGAPDPTNGALFFHAAQAAPGWFASRPRVGVIGGNVFYR